MPGWNQFTCKNGEKDAFAVIMADGSVMTWGDKSNGGDSSSVANHLMADVQHIYSTEGAFAALKADGTVVAWGRSLNYGHVVDGGNCSNVHLTANAG